MDRVHTKKYSPRKAIKRAQGLLRVTTLLSNAYTAKKTAEIIVNEGFKILGAATGDISLLNDNSKYIVLAERGTPPDFISEWPNIPEDTPLLTTEVIKTKKPYFIKNARDLDEKYAVAKAFISTSGARSAALLPLKIHNKIIGIMQFTFKTTQDFRREDIIFMNTLAGQCAQAFERVNAINTLKELNERKDEFISMASHELKTPLTSVSLYIGVLQRELNKKNESSSLVYVEKIKTQLKRLEKLIAGLLDVSRIQKGKIEFIDEVFRLDELILSTIEELRLTTSIEIVVESMSSVFIRGDKLRFYQLFTNLITNAIKYSSVDEKILVNLKKDSEHIVISVKDFGIGIPEEYHQKIFDRFYQVTKYSGTSYSGLGMGLFISNQVVKHYGGRIWVESTIGAGSTFYVQLPVARSE